MGGNTPGIIKYPFWKMTLENRSAAYACINQKESYIPPEIRGRSVCIPADIGHILKRLTLLEHCDLPPPGEAHCNPCLPVIPV